VKRILVTGASRGIGAAAARLLAERGDDVWMAARDPARLASSAAALGVDAQRTIAVDLAHGAAPSRMLAALGGATLDGIVWAAGVTRRAPVGSIRDDELLNVLRVNLAAPLLVTQALVPQLTDGASIVLVSSNLAHRPVPGSIAYAASKAALEAVARGLAQELAGRRIRVNAVAFGAVKTDMLEGVSMEALERAHPLGVGRAEDAARALVALLDAPWTTGATLVVDGGAGVAGRR
jgi:NAD(P)-dependent dehydrogenase (short-subunit alcohol dehydrogenase family)